MERPSVAAIDYHNHLDSLDPRDVLTIMDACGLERIVNITMQTGEEALAVMRRFHSAAPQRFSTIGWMDWAGIEQPDFVRKSVDFLERLVEHGACGAEDVEGPWSDGAVMPPGSYCASTMSAWRRSLRRPRNCRCR